jgi:acetylornithine/N-succinyldiaminopimelate aminotransferase
MNQNIIEREHESIFQTYKRLPVVVDRAEGCRIYDMDGNVYLDFLGGIAVNALGYCHPNIIEAAEKQIRKYMHISNYFYQEPQIKLAEKLKEKTGFNKVFFSNSGTEAMDGAIKLIRRWGNLNNKTDIVAFSGGFHGRTYGALSIMDKPLYKDKMGPFLPNTKILPYNDSEALIQGIEDKTSAIVLEFIQGEGGISVVKEEFVRTISELKEKYGFLVLADEIQAGVGRTGKFFGFEHFDIKPDIVTMAKGLGGGLPLGAIIAREHLAGVWEKGMHGTTYGGNAVACATGLVVLEELDNGVQQNVIETGNYLHEELVKIQNNFPSKILEVRGKGLMKGLLLSFDAQILVNALLDKRIITNAASGMVLRLVPPLIIAKNEVDELIEKLMEILKIN